MTDLTITAANVVAGANAVKKHVTAGETVTAGQTVYMDVTTRKYVKADADGAAALRVPEGIALNGASDGQPLTIQTEGDITIGATLTVGEIYVMSDTPGGIMPEGDLEAGDYVTVLGVAKSASVLALKINASGAAVPA